MSKRYTVKDAAALLGLSPSQVRTRLKNGELKGRQVKANRGQGYEWRVVLNGDEPAEEKKASPEISDPLVDIADELIGTARRLKRVVKEHDAKIRQQAISEFATTLAETVQKGVK